MLTILYLLQGFDWTIFFRVVELYIGLLSINIVFYCAYFD